MKDITLTSHVVMDIRIHAVTMKEALAFAEKRIMEGKPSMIATANAEMIMIAQKDPELARILNGADLVVPDGAGVLWAGEKLGTPFPERVTGADLTTELLKKASAMNWPVYFLGGNPGVAAKAARKFMEDHGSFSLVGCHDGYFNEEEEKKIIRQNISGEKIEVRPILKSEDIMEARKVVRKVYLDEKIEQYIADIVFATRYPEKYDLKELKDMIGFGGSPRASINLALAARSYAFIKRRGYVIPEDVRAVAHDVLRHRIGLTYEAEASNMTSDEIISKILNKVEVP